MRCREPGAFLHSACPTQCRAGACSHNRPWFRSPFLEACLLHALHLQASTPLPQARWRKCGPWQRRPFWAWPGTRRRGMCSAGCRCSKRACKLCKAAPQALHMHMDRHCKAEGPRCSTRTRALSVAKWRPRCSACVHEMWISARRLAQDSAGGGAPCMPQVLRDGAAGAPRACGNTVSRRPMRMLERLLSMY